MHLVNAGNLVYSDRAHKQVNGNSKRVIVSVPAVVMNAVECFVKWEKHNWLITKNGYEWITIPKGSKATTASTSAAFKAVINLKYLKFKLSRIGWSLIFPSFLPLFLITCKSVNDHRLAEFHMKVCNAILNESKAVPFTLEGIAERCWTLTWPNLWFVGFLGRCGYGRIPSRQERNLAFRPTGECYVSLSESFHL